MGSVTRGEDKRKKNNGWDAKRVIISILAVVMALLFLVPFVMDIVQYARAVTLDDIAQMTARQSALEREQGELEDRLEELETQEHSAVARCNLLSERITVLEDEVAATQDMVREYGRQIGASKKKLKKAKRKEKNYYKLFCQRVRSMEENGSQTYWQILFGASDFSDLLDRASLVSNIMDYDNGVLTNLEQARKKVARTTKTLQKKKAAKETALEALEQQQKEVTEASEEASAALQEIRRNENLYAGELSELDASAEALASDIVNAKSEYAAEQKAAAKRAAAEKRAAEKKAAAERKAAQKRAAEEKRAAEKKAAREKAAAEKKAAREKAAEEKRAEEEQEQAAQEAAEEENETEESVEETEPEVAEEPEDSEETEELEEMEEPETEDGEESEEVEDAEEADEADVEDEEQADADLEEPEDAGEPESDDDVEPEPEEEMSVSVAGGSSVADYAMNYIGGDYVWGGENLSTGVDCSGFVKCVYRHFGYSLPHSSGALASCGQGVSYGDAQPGDVICYDGHVGIYIGGGKMVNALGVKYGIVVNRVNPGKLVAVRRIV